MVPTHLRIVIAAVVVAAIPASMTLGWMLTRAGRLDRAPAASTSPVAATSGPQGTPSATPTATPEPGPPPLLRATATAPARIAEPSGLAWDARAIVTKPGDYFRVPCAGVEGGLVFTVSTPAAMECVASAVTAAGGSASGVAFLRQYQVFLASFQEHGRVDVGTTAAAWQNMGRPEPVFLNSTPAMLPVAWLLPGTGPTTAQSWLTQPAYAAVLGSANALAWPEYATVVEAPAGAGGGQAFLVTYPLRACRACANLATLRVTYRFDASGQYVGFDLLTPGPPG